jgi:CDP-6-deoxy-D-xylo-4-hexulose-3-dehydrase
MGYNLKPLDLQGAIGSEQLLKIDEIETNRKVSKTRLEKIFLENIPGVKAVTSLEESDTCWFGTPFICEEPGLKQRLVKYLEDNKIQTRNYFAGNILLHPGYSHLGNSADFPESNKVLDKVFFIGAAPHYTEPVFEYVEQVVKNFK